MCLHFCVLPVSYIVCADYRFKVSLLTEIGFYIKFMLQFILAIVKKKPGVAGYLEGKYEIRKQH